jgi:hypothetical protein
VPPTDDPDVTPPRDDWEADPGDGGSEPPILL